MWVYAKDLARSGKLYGPLSSRDNGWLRRLGSWWRESRPQPELPPPQPAVMSAPATSASQPKDVARDGAIAMASEYETNGVARRGGEIRADPVEIERMHPLDPYDYVRPVLRRWWLVIGLVILISAATYAYFRREPRVYQASTEVLLQQNSNAVSSVLGSPGEDPTRLDADAANIIRTPGVAVRAARAIRYHGDPLALLNDIAVQSNPNSDFLQIVAQASTGAMAAQIANGFARGYVQLLTNKSVLQAKRAAVLTEQQLRHLSGPDQATTRATLNQQLSQLQILENYPQSGAQQVNPASAPTAPISPKPTRDAVFGGAIALLLAVLLCFALERIDRRIKRIDELELLLGTPVLAAVPHTRATASIRGGAAAMDADITEPFRTLRAVVRLAATGEEVKTVLVTSGLAGEGKSTVARNLALAYCETDLSVLVIDCDLRGPVLDIMLTGSVREVGLTDVLAGVAMLEESIVRIGVRASAPGTAQPFPGEPVPPFQGESVQVAPGERLTIDMLPAGGARTNPATLLETRQFAELLAAMRRRYDVVVIDSAPILPVSDSLPLVSLVDGVVLVARAGVLTRGAAGRLRELIVQAQPRHLLGVVANDFPGSELGTYGMSYYGDRYGYGRKANKRKTRAAAGK